MEEAADKETNEPSKKMAYVEAALATNTEDYKRGPGIAEKIDDADLRGDTVSFLLYLVALVYLDSGVTAGVS